LLEIPNAGAYGLTASLVGFLSHPLAAEVIVEDGEIRSARRLTLREQDLLPELEEE
jgi:diaminopimelate decarboxylase